MYNNKELSCLRPTVTLTWHACKYTVHKLHQRCILKKRMLPSPPKHPVAYMPYISGTFGDTGVHIRHKTKPVFIQDRTDIVL